MSNIKTCPECGRQILGETKNCGVFCSEACSRNNYNANTKIVSSEEYDKSAYRQSIISAPIFWGFLGYIIGYSIDFPIAGTITFIIIGLALRWKYKKFGIVFGKVHISLLDWYRYRS
jgi:hypothetical protein